MACLLHHDMVEEILLKLPVRSLLRFKAVSKLFNSLISGPNFIANHHHHSKASPSSIVLGRGTIFRYDNLGNDTSHPPLIEQLGLPPWDGSIGSELRVRTLIGYANGLFCIKDHICNLQNQESVVFILWNPATKQYQHIRSPCIAGIGFGYHSGIQDYKLFGIPGTSFNRLHVLSLRGGSWTERQTRSDLWLDCDWFRQNSSAVVVDGIWYGAIVTIVENMLGLLSFDLKEESLAWIDSPIPPGTRDYTSTLGLYSGKLCLYVAADAQRQDRASCCDLQMWVMEERASWTKILAVDLGTTNVPVSGYLWLDRSLQTSRVLLNAYSWNAGGPPFRYFLYDPSTNSWREIPKGNDEDDCLYEAHDYVESLVSPEVVCSSLLRAL